MTILETFIKLRDDLKLWVTNNLKEKANISYVDNKVTNIDFPVDSVNGQTGDVQLTADDVGALPISGGTMTGILGTKGINLTYKTDYGGTMPDDADNGRLFFVLDDTADRILRFGLDNGWYYQKFESGIVKCWRSENRTITSGEWNEGKGGGINAGLISVKASALTTDIQFEFPSSNIFTFIERPTEIASISNNTSWRFLTLMGRNHSSVTLSTTKLYNIITYNPEDSLNVTMEFFVVGRWK